MLNHFARLGGLLLILVLFAAPAHAQQDDAAQAGGGTLAIDQGLTADEAFAGGVERSGTVGGQPTQTVGAAPSSSTAGTAGRTGRTGGGFAGGLGGFGAAFGNLFGGNTGANNNATDAIRTRIRSRVEVQPMPSVVVQSNAQNRLVTATGLQTSAPSNRFGAVRVEMQGRTAVLSGTVPTQADRRMSQLLMRLEPGVSQIENRLTTP